MKALTIVAFSLALSACPSADGDTSVDDDAGPSDDIDAELICGEGATLGGSAEEPALVGPCVISSRDQLSLFNSSGVRRFIGNLIVDSGGGLSDGDFTQLEEVLGELHVGPSTSLVTIRFPVLSTVSRLNVQENAVLSFFQSTALVSVPELFLFLDNPALPQCSVDELLAQLEAVPADVNSEGNCAICCDE